MTRLNILRKLKITPLVYIYLLFLSGHSVADYVPYPGKIPVKLIEIEAPNIIMINFETWPGFSRDFKVTLPGIQVPEDSSAVELCERKLAQKAIALTRNFLINAKDIRVWDMRMETSADTDVIAPIYTKQGGLIEALTRQGLARPDSVDPTTPWCKP